MDKASKNFVVPPTELEVKTAVAEEIRKWKNFRLQQVRAQARELSSKTLSRVRSAEQKEIQKLREQIQQKSEEEKENRLEALQCHLNDAQQNIGYAHRAARQQVAEEAKDSARLREMEVRARERGRKAIAEEQMKRREAALQQVKNFNHKKEVVRREQLRAQRVAQLPTPPAIRQQRQRRSPPPAPPSVVVQEAGTLATTSYRPSQPIVMRHRPGSSQDARSAALAERQKRKEEEEAEERRREEMERRVQERGREAEEKERVRLMRERLLKRMAQGDVEAFLRGEDVSRNTSSSCSPFARQGSAPTQEPSEFDSVAPQVNEEETLQEVEITSQANQRSSGKETLFAKNTQIGISSSSSSADYSSLLKEVHLSQNSSTSLDVDLSENLKEAEELLQIVRQLRKMKQQPTATDEESNISPHDNRNDVNISPHDNRNDVNIFPHENRNDVNIFPHENRNDVTSPRNTSDAISHGNDSDAMSSHDDGSDVNYISGSDTEQDQIDKRKDSRRNEIIPAVETNKMQKINDVRLPDILRSHDNAETVQHKRQDTENSASQSCSGEFHETRSSSITDSSMYDSEVIEEIRIRLIPESSSSAVSQAEGPDASPIPVLADSKTFARDMKNYLGLDTNSSSEYFYPPSVSPVDLPPQVYDNLQLLRRNRIAIEEQLTSLGVRRNRRGNRNNRHEEITSSDSEIQSSDERLLGKSSCGKQNSNSDTSPSVDLVQPSTSAFRVPVVPSSFLSTPVRAYTENVKMDGAGRRPLRRKDKFELQKKIVLQNYIKRLLVTKAEDMAQLSEGSVSSSGIEISSSRLLNKLACVSESSSSHSDPNTSTSKSINSYDSVQSSISSPDVPLSSEGSAKFSQSSHDIATHLPFLPKSRTESPQTDAYDEDNLDRVPSRLSDLDEAAHLQSSSGKCSSQPPRGSSQPPRGSSQPPRTRVQTPEGVASLSVTQSWSSTISSSVTIPTLPSTSTPAVITPAPQAPLSAKVSPITPLDRNESNDFSAGAQVSSSDKNTDKAEETSPGESFQPEYESFNQKQKAISVKSKQNRSTNTDDFHVTGESHEENFPRKPLIDQQDLLRQVLHHQQSLRDHVVEIQRKSSDNSPNVKDLSLKSPTRYNTGSSLSQHPVDVSFQSHRPLEVSSPSLYTPDMSSLTQYPLGTPLSDSHSCKHISQNYPQKLQSKDISSKSDGVSTSGAPVEQQIDYQRQKEESATNSSSENPSNDINLRQQPCIANSKSSSEANESFKEIMQLLDLSKISSIVGSQPGNRSVSEDNVNDNEDNVNGNKTSGSTSSFVQTSSRSLNSFNNNTSYEDCFSGESINTESDILERQLRLQSNLKRLDEMMRENRQGTLSAPIIPSSSSSCNSVNLEEILKNFKWTAGMLSKMNKLEENFTSGESSCG